MCQLGKCPLAATLALDSSNAGAYLQASTVSYVYVQTEHITRNDM